MGLRILLIAFGLALIFFVAGFSNYSLRIRSDVMVDRYSTTLVADFKTPGGSGPFPTVVLMHGCGGLLSRAKASLETHASFLRDHGFATLILDSFSSRGGNINRCQESALGAARYYRVFDALNTLTFLKEQDFVDTNNIFLMGQSSGGSVSILVAGGGSQFNFADDLKYSAVVAFYPWCGMLIDELVSPLLVLGGAKDDWTPPDPCLNQVKTVKGAKMEVIIYPEARHGFDLPTGEVTFEGHRVGGHKPSAQDSRQRMLEFFQMHLSRIKD